MKKGLIISGISILVIALVVFFALQEQEQTYVPIPADQISEEIQNGIHVETGLLDGEGLNLVIANCTACHSAQLITQNRADRDGWKKMIRWMQETQNLWDLGTQEETILNYLANHYAPAGAESAQNFRRAPLRDIEWYELKD